jgi:hypothetical protein
LIIFFITIFFVFHYYNKHLTKFPKLYCKSTKSIYSFINIKSIRGKTRNINIFELMDRTKKNSGCSILRGILKRQPNRPAGTRIGNTAKIAFLAISLNLIVPDLVTAQKKAQHVSPPGVDDFYESLVMLSSPKMEGREAGKPGSLLASDYIASKMKTNALQPFGDISVVKGINQDNNRSWFQYFKALTFKNYPDSMILTGHVSVTRADTVVLRNVLGIIYGKDSSRSILIGAHYDHLGIRNGKIFYGADDNASGVAGMLSLAGKWSESGLKPPCNLVFAAWTAEEKGLIGSSYYIQQNRSVLSKILLTINMDMIAGSAPEDTARRIISIGTLPADAGLRQIAVKANSNMKNPFVLDLWDVTGHEGSDYAYFSSSGIPVMTFFSGFCDYYHTPGDTMEKTDLPKMENILRLVNECIWQVTDSLRAR